MNTNSIYSSFNSNANTNNSLQASQTSFLKSKKEKIKMKKKAFDPVDKKMEKEKDPKYKTELCKTYEEKGVCPYGNTCRFAHGKQDLLLEANDNNEQIKYKIKNCYSFFQFGYCPYGSRCHLNILLE